MGKKIETTYFNCKTGALYTKKIGVLVQRNWKSTNYQSALMFSFKVRSFKSLVLGSSWSDLAPSKHHVWILLKTIFNIKLSMFSQELVTKRIQFSPQPTVNRNMVEKLN